MRLDELTGARVALLGVGRDVKAALPSIVASRPASLVVVDELHRPGTELDLGGEAGVLPVVSLAEAAESADVFVRSPGFPRYSPELSGATERGARVTTPLDLWMGELPEDRRVVAVTGTKGKSTTTSMIAALAARYGMVAEVAGNIGTPVFAGGREPQVDFVVLEVSSYQAADLHHVPEVAVVTSLAEDHVDWHGSVERYVADKARVLANDGGVADVVFVASSVRDPHDLPGAALCDLRLVDVPPSQGLETPAHMLSNAALATAVVAHLTGQEVSVTEALAVAPRLESRLEVLAQGDTVWIDDALGSNPSATAAGLAWVRSFNQPAVVLLGGAERGVDVGPLRAEVAEWAPGTLRAIALPDNGSELAARAGIEVLASASSVREAVALAGAKVPSGAVVLFSPSAPTPKAQGTWRERSAELRAAIEELHDERRHAGR